MITPETLVEIDRTIDDVFEELANSLKENQPALLEWLAAKFQLYTSREAMLGVAVVALALVEKEKESD